MQNSGYSDVIIDFDLICDRQLSIHIDFTTLNWVHFIILADTDAYNGNFMDEDIKNNQLSVIGRFVRCLKKSTKQNHSGQ